MDLNSVLEKHRKWLNNEPDGERAYLRRANLREVNFDGADLRVANLREANFGGANLRRANFEGANLEGANLQGTDLAGANLRNSNLQGANLEGANLEGADLRETNLSGTQGLLDPISYITENFETIPEGIVAYKIFEICYTPNPKWKIEPGSIIEEVVNYDRTIECACGINVATLDWVKRICPDYNDMGIWKCLIRWEWLPGVCVPYNTDGKIRASKVQLLKIVS